MSVGHDCQHDFFYDVFGKILMKWRAMAGVAYPSPV